MDYIKHHVKLDFSKRNVRPTIAISGGDTNSHKIIFSFCNASEPIDITKATVCGVSINGAEPCNNVKINVEVNTVEYIPSLEFFSEGTNPCVLTLADARGKVLYAPVFYILIDDIYSDEIKENFCNDLKSNNAWGIVAKTVEYAQLAYTAVEGAQVAAEDAKVAQQEAEAAKNNVQEALEGYVKQDNYLSDKNAIDAKINEIDKRIDASSGGVKEYSETETYNKGDIVSYNGSLYTPLEDGTIGIEPILEAAWQNLVANSGGSSTYGYVPIPSWDELVLGDDYDGLIVPPEYREIFNKALWYRITISVDDERDESLIDAYPRYRIQGLLFLNKSLNNVQNDTFDENVELITDTVTGSLFPQYFKRGFLNSDGEEVWEDVITSPISAVISSDGFTLLLDIDGVIIRKDEENNVQFVHFYKDTLSGHPFATDSTWNLLQKFTIEAYAPTTSEESSTFALRREYTEQEQRMLDFVSSKIAERKAARQAKQAEAKQQNTNGSEVI